MDQTEKASGRAKGDNILIFVMLLQVQRAMSSMPDISN
jgi:hypothetical protein